MSCRRLFLDRAVSLITGRCINLVDGPSVRLTPLIHYVSRTRGISRLRAGAPHSVRRNERGPLILMNIITDLRLHAAADTHSQRNADSHIHQGVRSVKTKLQMRSQPPRVTSSHALRQRVDLFEDHSSHVCPATRARAATHSFDRHNTPADGGRQILINLYHTRVMMPDSAFVVLEARNRQILNSKGSALSPHSSQTLHKPVQRRLRPANGRIDVKRVSRGTERTL
ncbi:hypothetical protein EVAR_53563_1 [Eumeta japonica]|uniref:Uncharacterized protein n=1 Tax=Eumeta variegata TaxID=151549 RepID=A0A4C1YPC7_EUMVA|nr:hypothetical protein EVAR_53563_1 [Eumeta japonica]